MASDPTQCATCRRKMTAAPHGRVRIETEALPSGIETHVLWFCSDDCEAHYQARTERPAN